MFCGGNKLYLADNKFNNEGKLNIFWEWIPELAKSLPQIYIDKYFTVISECKPIDEGKLFLITSLLGGTSVIERSTNDALFYAETPNSHTAEFITKHKIAVALSNSKNINSINIYDIRLSNVLITNVSFNSPRGLVWHNKLQQLYALGYNELRVYRFENEYRTMIQLYSYPLPDNSGNDLQWFPTVNKKKSQLIYTTHYNVYIYNIKTNETKPYNNLLSQINVKSISFQKNTNELMFIQ